MGCPKLTYQQNGPLLKCVWNKNEPEKSEQWFYTVDPLADNYFGISPYVYCADNPVIFVDPDGKAYKLVYGKNGQVVNYYRVCDDEAYNMDGEGNYTNLKEGYSDFPVVSFAPISDDGGPAGSGVGLLSPVNTKYPITSPYTEGNRVIPELEINRPHLAIDIGTPEGTPIRSPWSGKIVMAQNTQYGLSVIIKHDYQYNGQFIQTGYAHLSEMNVTNGLTIDRGFIIGYTGTWGTGPHLHFTLRIGDQKVNPTILFPYK